jgi:hypothetical protein
MKQILKLTACTLLMGIVIFTSCKKEISCESCKDNNKPPIANAGADQTITPPKDSAILDGSASTDPDGTITSYKWTKIAGPSSPNFSKPDSSKTSVKTLVAGVYKFELTVTDNGGLSTKDTMQVMVDAPGNQPPVACAGADQVITLPTNSVTLDGSCSADPDNNTTAYNWAKISGPSSFNIANVNAVLTQVTNLVEGVYLFELKITDAGGLFSKDTMQVTMNSAIVAKNCDEINRPKINAQLIPVGTLSQARIGMAVASAGNKILFAGGSFISGGFYIPSSKIDIYDLTTQTWSTAELSEARYLIAAVASGNKIFFGGGETGDGTDPTKTVDIYDVSTNMWSTSSLSLAGHSIAAAAVGNKVFFAGGDGGFTGGWDRGSRVDIYNLETNTWSITFLSGIKRGGHSANTVNNKIYFAGGETWPTNPVPGSWYVSKTIDIYDNATNSWSTTSMMESKIFHASIAVGDNIYWCGGQTGSFPSITASCSVEIRNVNTGNSTIQNLFAPGLWSIDDGQNAVVKGNKIILYSSFQHSTNKFDVYDITTNTWSIGVLPIIIEGAAIISVNNIIYIAGGYVNDVLSNQVWKLEF